MSWTQALFSGGQTEAPQEQAAGSQGHGISDFRSDNWAKMSSDERVEALSSFASDYAKSIGIQNPPTITGNLQGSSYGVYSPWGNTIRVNMVACENPYEALDTVVHEMNHAYQHECIQNGTDYTSGERAVMKAQDSQFYRDDADAYYSQTMEIDSNNAALNEVLRHQDSFADDPAFYEYLQGRGYHYDHTNQLLIYDTDFCNQVERTQLDQAYQSGILTKEEYDAGVKCIDEGNGVRARSEALTEEITAARQESAEAYSSVLHDQYVEAVQSGLDESTALELKGQNAECIADMTAKMNQVDERIDSVRQEQHEYITSHNYGVAEVETDPKCIAFREELSSLQAERSSIDYHVAELKTDTELIDQEMGWTEQNAQEAESETNSLSEGESGVGTVPGMQETTDSVMIGVNTGEKESGVENDSVMFGVSGSQAYQSAQVDSAMSGISSSSEQISSESVSGTQMSGSQQESSGASGQSQSSGITQDM